MRIFLEAILLPPSGPLILGLLGALLWRIGSQKLRTLGRRMVWGALALLLFASQPFVAAALLRAHQSAPMLPHEGPLPEADGIVILSAGLLPWSREYGSATIDEVSLARLRYGAFLARRTELPVLTSGGVVFWQTRPLARIMAEILEGEFEVPVRWREEESHNTAGNAYFSAKLLREQGVQRVFLVTHAWHMPRAQRAFERAGLEVVPAPTAFHPWPTQRWVSFVPSHNALKETSWAIHEALGRLWYRLSGTPPVFQ